MKGQEDLGGSAKTYEVSAAEVCRPAEEGEFERIVQLLTRLQIDLLECWADLENEFESLKGDQRKSAQNLVHYLALRRHDIRELQNDLARHGISSLGRAESHVMTNINKVIKLLHRIVQRSYQLPPGFEEALSFDEGTQILARRTDALLGAQPENRKVRIMVTLPSEAADDYDLVRDLVASGMDCARINCAHDEAKDWERMVENVRRAEREAGRKCKICIDVAGPKLRTGAIENGPRVLKWSPARDVFGRMTKAAQVWLTPTESPETPPFSADAELTFPKDFLLRLRLEDRIRFIDARESSRVLTVKKFAGDSVWAEAFKTTYVTPETEFRIAFGKADEARSTAKPGDIPARQQFLLLKKGDLLILNASENPGSPAKFAETGELVEPARIPCTLPEVFNDVKIGESIWFDDGRIGGIIKSVSAAAAAEIHVEITQAAPRGARLRSDKGINLPDSDLRLPPLTMKDLEDLKFIVREADLVGYSFVRSAGDVAELQAKLKELGGEHLGVVLKIEARRAFERLPEILLASMDSSVAGVMIARGDLAVESGFERMAEVQEEILWMCEAAHLPVIWATQVLEQLSREGVPSRAEITDAAMSERAECVMLNKGPFVVEAVRALNNILSRMQTHQNKKRPMLRNLHLADRFFATFKE